MKTGPNPEGEDRMETPKPAPSSPDENDACAGCGHEKKRHELRCLTQYCRCYGFTPKEKTE